jgi:hypothetical protein
MLRAILEPILFVLCLLPRWLIGWLVVFVLGYAWGHSDGSSTRAERERATEARARIAVHLQTRAPGQPASGAVAKAP